MPEELGPSPGQSSCVAVNTSPAVNGGIQPDDALPTPACERPLGDSIARQREGSTIDDGVHDQLCSASVDGVEAGSGNWQRRRLHNLLERWRARVIAQGR